ARVGAQRGGDGIVAPRSQLARGVALQIRQAAQRGCEHVSPRGSQQRIVPLRLLGVGTWLLLRILRVGKIAREQKGDRGRGRNEQLADRHVSSFLRARRSGAYVQ